MKRDGSVLVLSFCASFFLLVVALCITTTARAVDRSSLLETDWLMQADDKPTLKRVMQEIDWAHAMAK
ncbi:MAG: hypothetical protein GY809_27795, partial [Planctomycetes bacterium]|nr:hypothetical protein [Planctomycetota bacterium]